MSATDRFAVRYEIDDGYAGGSRPHEFYVRSDDLEPDMTEDRIVQYLYDCAVEDMHQRISVSVKNEPKFLAWAKEKIAQTSPDLKVQQQPTVSSETALAKMRSGVG